MKFKILINSLILLVLTIIIAFLLSQLVSKTTTDSAANIVWNVYNLKPNSVDVVIVGPSTSRYAYNSFVAWDRYGITTLNCSFGYLAGPVVKNMLIECLKRQKPKVILINADCFLFLNKGDFRNNAYTGISNLSFDVVPELKWSLNKIDFLKKIIGFYQLNTKEIIHFLFPITSSHKISIAGIINSNRKMYLASRYKHFFNKISASFNIRKTKIDKYSVEKEIYTKESLEDLFDYCKKLDIPVIFIGVPHPVSFVKPYLKIYDLYNMFFSFVKENNFDYINPNDYYTIKDLKLSYQDTYDASHLNYWGSEKYTNYIAKILVEKYHLEDKRNNPDYSFWNDAAKEYSKTIKEKFDIDVSIKDTK